MLEQTYFVYNTVLGRVTIAAQGNTLTHFAFGAVCFAGSKQPTACTNQASNEVLEYLAGKRMEFSMPLALEGTEFQRQVWNELLRIPYGQVRTYSEIAKAIGNPKARQAVGQACNKNPLPLFVPCHRVISATGSLGGYAYGQHIKQFLLALESDTVVRH